jgi:hypothetical protein
VRAELLRGALAGVAFFGVQPVGKLPGDTAGVGLFLGWMEVSFSYSQDNINVNIYKVNIKLDNV